MAPQFHLLDKESGQPASIQIILMSVCKKIVLQQICVLSKRFNVNVISVQPLYNASQI